MKGSWRALKGKMVVLRQQRFRPTYILSLYTLWQPPSPCFLSLPMSKGSSWMVRIVPLQCEQNKGQNGKKGIWH